MDFSEIWKRRYLLAFLIVTEIKARYKQTAIGFAWAVIRPLTMVLVLTFLFGGVAGLPSGDVPYPLFVFSGLLLWQFFANVVTGCASSIIANRPLVDRIYCPRVILPISAIGVATFDLLIGAALYMVIMLVFGMVPPIQGLYAPLILLFVAITGLAVGLWLAAIAVWLRDIKFAVTYLLQLGLLLTPVGYASVAVPDGFSLMLLLNPMASAIDMFRWAMFGTDAPALSAILASLGISALLMIAGLRFFAALERSFADVI